MANFLEQINLDYGFDSNNSKINITSDKYESRIAYLQQLSVLSEINHLFKDNLCYYTEETLCTNNSQFDYFNTGLLGALDML